MRVSTRTKTLGMGTIRDRVDALTEALEEGREDVGALLIVFLGKGKGGYVEVGGKVDAHEITVTHTPKPPEGCSQWNVSEMELDGPGMD
jgi:hypothetical protein